MHISKLFRIRCQQTTTYDLKRYTRAMQIDNFVRLHEVLQRRVLPEKSIDITSHHSMNLHCKGTWTCCCCLCRNELSCHGSRKIMTKVLFRFSKRTMSLSSRKCKPIMVVMIQFLGHLTFTYLTTKMCDFFLYLKVEISFRSFDSKQIRRISSRAQNSFELYSCTIRALSW